MIEYLFTFIE